jgi:hypothetical protein
MSAFLERHASQRLQRFIRSKRFAFNGLVEPRMCYNRAELAPTEPAATVQGEGEGN